MWKIAIHFEFLHMHNFCKLLTIIKSNTWSVKKRYSYTFTKPYSYKFNARLNLVHIIQYLEQNLRHFRSWAADYQVTWRQSTCRRIYLIYWLRAVSLLFADKIVWKGQCTSRHWMNEWVIVFVSRHVRGAASVQVSFR